MDNKEQILNFNYGDAFSVHTCKLCGLLYIKDAEQIHKDWHYASIIGRLNLFLRGQK